MFRKILSLFLIYFLALFPTQIQAQSPNVKAVLLSGFPSFVPASMRGNPPDIYVNYKTNQAWIKNGNRVTSATAVTNVSRASAATQVDSNDNWSQCLSGQLCRSNLGASIWEARTNSIRNNTMTGAVVMADGVQLLTNGTFVGGSGTVCPGWTVNLGSGAINFTGTSVQLNGDGSTNNTYISQKLSGLVAGRNYVVAITTPGGASVQIAVGTSAGNASIVAFTNTVGNGNASTFPDRIGFTAPANGIVWISLSRVLATQATITSVSVIDGERIENGGFTANPLNASQSTVQNGWQWSIAGGTTTVTYTGGNSVTITPDGTNSGRLDTSFPTVAGFTYTLTVNIGTNIAAISVGTSQGGSSLLSINASPGTGLQFQFTALGNTTWLRFSRASSGVSVISNVSVQSAGALPNLWPNFFGTSLQGLLTQIVAVGTTQGVNTMDVRFFGTTNTASSIYVYCEQLNTIAATYGQTLSTSMFLQLVGGSLTNLTTLRLLYEERSSGGTALADNTSSDIFASLGTFTRQQFSGTVTNASTAFIQPGFKMTTAGNGVAIDATLRMGWHQNENNSLINSTVASATKAADGSGGVNGSAVYSVGGGTGTAATLNVTWAAGVMTVNSVASPGSYTVFPPSPATLTYVSGTATGWTGATVNLTPTDNSTNGAASNPILTTNAAATRNAEVDTLVLTGLPSFGSAFTLWASGIPMFYVTQNSANGFLSVDDGSSNNRGVLFAYRQSLLQSQVNITSTGGANVMSSPMGLTPINTRQKLALAGAFNNGSASKNGGAVVTDSSVDFPVGLNAVGVGIGISNGSFPLNGNLEEFAIWFTQRVPDAQLQGNTQ